MVRYYDGEIGLVDLLYKFGADINHQNYYGDTPLYTALYRDSGRLVHYQFSSNFYNKIFCICRFYFF
jgi:ankyrin repeat protein